MIRYEELQIGDFVLVNGTPRRVEAITKRKIGYHLNPKEDNRLYYARLRDVEPIWLSEEFLERNGCVEGADEVFRIFSGIHVVELKLRHSYRCNVKIFVDHPFDSDTMLDSCFWAKLHVLQQILRIFEIEKEWKL